jgi:hypothetical protein
MWTRRAAVGGTGERAAAAGTARNMLDAVTYLIRVASKAGLEGVAVKLSAVRLDLVEAASNASDAADARDQAAADHGTEQNRRKRHAKPH